MSRGVRVFFTVDLEPGDEWDGVDSPITADNAGMAIKRALEGPLTLLSLTGIAVTMRVARVRPLDLEEPS